MEKDIPLFKVFMDEGASSSLEETLYSGHIGQGPKVDDFEIELSNFLGNPFVNTVNSATSGLHLALHYLKKLDQSNRDEVISTPLTCTATNFAIVANNLKIKWADLDLKTCNICLDDVRKKIGPKTLAIMVVHWGGYPCNLEKLEDIKKETKEKYGHDLHIIEDCAHAFGSKFKNQNIGNGKNICVFSFQAIKHLTTGDGGLITSPDKNLHEKFKLLRWYGLDRTSKAEFRCEQNVQDWGFKFHMNDIAATIGLSNIKHTKNIVSKHHNNQQYLLSQLKEVPGITLLENNPENYSASWITTILAEDCNKLMQKLKNDGIAVSKVHGRNDTHDCLKEFKTSLPNTDFISDHMCCLPCGWWLSQEDLEYIIVKIKEGW